MIVGRQLSADYQRACALAMFRSSVTSASHSGNVVVQSYQCSPFSIIFLNVLNKISEIMDPTMKIKANANIGSVYRRIANQQGFMEPINVD
jgi:hypothetical protein